MSALNGLKKKHSAMAGLKDCVSYWLRIRFTIGLELRKRLRR